MPSINCKILIKSHILSLTAHCTSTILTTVLYYVKRYFSDDDSIEDKEGGSGLTTPLETSFRESIMDDFEEMERKIMEEEY